MDLFLAFHTFVRIAESGSFSAVARESGTTQPAISRQVAALEQHLGVRLLHRSTRSLALTEDGRDLLGHARRTLEDVEEAKAAVGRRHATLTGLVRLACPASLGRLYIAPQINRLLTLYPGLSIELHMSDDRIDLVSEGIDLAIRGGHLSDTSLVARRIGCSKRHVVASAEYLERHGTPTGPADLSGHTCLAFLLDPSPNEWILTGLDRTVTIPITGRFSTDSTDALREAVLAGTGLAVAATWLFDAELRSGQVKTVLEAYHPESLALHAVYPSRRNLAPRTRAVIDFFVQALQAEPALCSATYQAGSA